MAENIKFTEEEIKKLKELQDSYNTLILKYGQIEIQMVRLEKVKKQLDNEYTVFLEQQKTLSEELSNKYGDGVFNPASGEFTPYDKK